MDARKESARLLLLAASSEEETTTLPEVGAMVMAVKRHLDAMDEDLQKLRKELRTRNGGGGND